MIHFFCAVYLIRFHTENSQKNLYFRKKSTFIRTRYGQNQHSWRQNGVTMFFHELKNTLIFREMAFRRILAFYNSRKWGHFRGICTRLSAPLFSWWNWSERFQSSPLRWSVRSLKHNHIKNRYPLIIQRFSLTGKWVI